MMTIDSRILVQGRIKLYIERRYSQHHFVIKAAQSGGAANTIRGSSFFTA